MTDEPFDPMAAIAAEGFKMPEPIDDIRKEEADALERATIILDNNGHAKDFAGGNIRMHADTFSITGKLGINPKDALGAQKPDPSVVPPCAELHLATAMMDGAVKYGPFNWRDNPVQARIYYAAARRHLAQWLDGEDFDPTSEVHHLGHAMACCAILLDAYEQGNLVDDRPVAGRSGALIRQFKTESKFRAIGRTVQRWLGK